MSEPGVSNNPANQGTLQIAARSIPVPTSISDTAQAQLRAAFVMPAPQYPEGHDTAGWAAHVKAADGFILPMLQAMTPPGAVQVSERMMGGVRVFDIVPEERDDDETVMLDMHGGALIYCAGDLARQMAVRVAVKYRRRVLSVDYRMPPHHPYPAALDDCLAVYRALLGERPAEQIIAHGGSAGGNLIAASVLRMRDEGLALPVAVILASPEADLTESGDSFVTNNGIDTNIAPMMPINLLYANGEPLTHPYISPLFGDFKKGFPPCLLITGTRDLFLSNTVRMHYALRAADVDADLLVMEAGAHGNFAFGPEADAEDREVRKFIAKVLAQTASHA